MSDLRVLCLPIFSDNYVWMLADADDRVVIVDPGDAEPVLRALAEGLSPQAILVTHHHPDHIGGVAGILAAYDIPCYAPVDPRIPQATHRVQDGSRVTVATMGVTFETLAVPGHTDSHVAYRSGEHLFCGDTLFSLGCGRLFEGSPEQMLASLDRLAALPDATRVYCTHEYTLANARFAERVEPENPERDVWLTQVRSQREQGHPSLPSTIAVEKQCNPFLRVDQDRILDALAGHTGQRPATRQQAFAALRQWKNDF